MDKDLTQMGVFAIIIALIVMSGLGFIAYLILKAVFGGCV
jgi:hypothetical protein